jgi:hypothetical protein
MFIDTSLNPIPAPGSRMCCPVKHRAPMERNNSVKTEFYKRWAALRPNQFGETTYYYPTMYKVAILTLCCCWTK